LLPLKLLYVTDKTIMIDKVLCAGIEIMVSANKKFKQFFN